MSKSQGKGKTLVSKAAAALGRKGGLARYERMSADDRKAQARRAAMARWSRKSLARNGQKEDA